MYSISTNDDLDVYTQRANYQHYSGYQHPTIRPVVILIAPMHSAIYILPEAIWLIVIMSTNENFNMIRLEDHVDGRAAWTPLEYLRRVVTAGGLVPPLHDGTPALEDI